MSGIVKPVLVAPPVVRSQQLARGLLGAYVLNENPATVLQDAEHRNNGVTWTNMDAGNWSYTTEGAALTFNGTNENIALAANASPAALPWSLAVRFRLTDLNAERMLFATDSANNYFGCWLSILNNGHFFLNFGDGTGTGGNDRRGFETTASVSVGVWYDVLAVVRSATDFSVFVNGVDWEGSDSGNGGAYAPGSSVGWIGKRRTTYMKGEIAHVYHWNEALGEGDAQELAHRPYGLFAYDPLSWLSSPAGAYYYQRLLDNRRGRAA